MTTKRIVIIANVLLAILSTTGMVALNDQQKSFIISTIGIFFKLDTYNINTINSQSSNFD